MKPGRILVIVLMFMMLALACAHVSPSKAPQAARVALAKVGALYAALAVAYKNAVEIRVQVCKARLGEDATEAERTTCMGELGSEGKVTLALIRIADNYDDAVGVLEQLEQDVATLEHGIAEAGGQR